MHRRATAIPTACVYTDAEGTGEGKKGKGKEREMEGWKGEEKEGNPNRYI